MPYLSDVESRPDKFQFHAVFFYVSYVYFRLVGITPFISQQKRTLYAPSGSQFRVAVKHPYLVVEQTYAQRTFSYAFFIPQFVKKPGQAVFFSKYPNAPPENFFGGAWYGIILKTSVFNLRYSASYLRRGIQRVNRTVLLPGFYKQCR